MRLTIRQTEPPRPGTRPRVLELGGSLGPLDSLRFGGTHRGEVEWLPGSTVAAVRLDGPEEGPTDFRFKWRGRDFTLGEAMLDGQPLATIDDIVDALDSFRRDTALVEVTWRGRTQRAKIDSFIPEHGFENEVEATLTLQWVEALQGVRLRSRPPRPNPPSFAAKLQAGFDDDMASVESVVTWVRGPIDLAAQAVAQIRANIFQVKNAALSLTSLASDATGVVRAIGATIQQLFTSTDEVDASMAISSDQLAQTDEARMQILARLYRTQTLKAARATRYSAALERRNYRPESDVLAIHEAVLGDTIWSVARLWYDNASLGPMLARRNNLISTVLRPGQRLVIPVVVAGAA